MPFILRIHSYANQPMPTPQSRRFDAAGGTIGRTTENDLVLEDPGKYISRKHARVECRAGEYFFIDQGSNPSLINDLPLGNGNEAKLRDGDLIRVGDYLIEAVFEPEAGLAGSSYARMESAPARTAGAPVIVSRPVPAAAVREPDFLSDRSILYKGTLGELAGGADPLGLGMGQAARSDPLANGARGSQSDHISPENQAFPLPPAQTAASLAIPDDYDPLADLRPQAAQAAHAAGTAQTSAMPSGPRSTAMPHTSAHASESEVLGALLRGLGLPALKTTLPPEQMAELIGSMLREAVHGTMDVLAARAATKREVRAEVTMLAAQANNPLKFFREPADALKQMLTNELPGYMSAEKAIGVAFDDLKAHEIAMIAGMREALLGVLARFDPAGIENQLKASGMMDAMVPANRKARLWDRLVELYSQVAREADSDFQRLFGDRFVAAYQAQVQRLKAGMNRQNRQQEQQQR